jgi:hypothetical protein
MNSNLITGQELEDLSKSNPAYKKKSRQAIHKHKNLPFVLDGRTRMYDKTDPTIISYLKGEKIKRPATAKPSKGKETSKPKAQAKPKKEQPAASNQAIDIPDEIKSLAESGELTLEMAMSMSKTDLEKWRIYEVIKSTRTKTEKDRAMVIDKKLIRSLLSKIYSVDVNVFIPMKDKMLPDLAAVFGVDDPAKRLAAGKIIDDYVWRVQSQKKNIINKWLQKFKSKEVE